MIMAIRKTAKRVKCLKPVKGQQCACAGWCGWSRGWEGVLWASETEM